MMKQRNNICKLDPIRHPFYLIMEALQSSTLHQNPTGRPQVTGESGPELGSNRHFEDEDD